MGGWAIDWVREWVDDLVVKWVAGVCGSAATT